jgi:hypothetical protein
MKVGSRFLFTILVFLYACIYDSLPKYKYSSDGTITEPDHRTCSCCGGWFISIQNTQYHFGDLPANSGINLEKDKFPIEVTLDWTLNNSCNLIVINRIAKK